MSDSPADSLQPTSLGILDHRPLVSVITPCYNAGELVNQAVDCIAAQTYEHWEMVICDDGSTDDSWARLQAISARESRIKLHQQENGGSAAATNAAYGRSIGDIIVFLDADDLSDSRRLEVIVQAFIDNPSCGFVTHRLRRIDADGKILKGVVPGRPTLVSGWFAPKVFDMRTYGCSSPTSGIAIRRQILDRIMPIPDRCKRTQDAYLIAASLLLTESVGIEEVYGSYRIHSGGQTSGRRFRKEWHEKKIIDQIDLAASLGEFSRTLGVNGLEEWIHGQLVLESPELMREVAYYWICTGNLHHLSPHDLAGVFARINSNRLLFGLVANTPTPLRPAIPYVLRSAERIRSFFGL